MVFSDSLFQNKTCAENAFKLFQHGVSNIPRTPLSLTSAGKDRFPPAWCFDEWCYVDPDNCKGAQAVRSKYFPDDEVPPAERRPFEARPRARLRAR